MKTCRNGVLIAVSELEYDKGRHVAIHDLDAPGVEPLSILSESEITQICLRLQGDNNSPYAGRNYVDGFGRTPDAALQSLFDALAAAE